MTETYREYAHCTLRSTLKQQPERLIAMQYVPDQAGHNSFCPPLCSHATPWLLTTAPGRNVANLDNTSLGGKAWSKMTNAWPSEGFLQRGAAPKGRPSALNFKLLKDGSRVCLIFVQSLSYLSCVLSKVNLRSFETCLKSKYAEMRKWWCIHSPQG